MNIVSFLIMIFLYTCMLIYPPVMPCQDISLYIQEGDQLWGKREDEKMVKSSINSYKHVLSMDPNNYEACWKIARAYFYLLDMLPETNEMKIRHKVLGNEGMRYGLLALTLDPGRIEGHYYYGLCVAEYTLGISRIRALRKGLASEFQNQMEESLKINRYYDSAGPLRALGRYWFRIPWPKRNLEKSIHYLNESVAFSPMNVRGHVYLAESYLKAGDKELAREHLNIALMLPSNLKEEASVQRWKEQADVLLKKEF